MYTLSHFVGEGELVARSTRTTTEYRVPRGYTARPNYAAGSFGGFRAPTPAITADSRSVIFSIEPAPMAVETARRAKKKPADHPKSTLAILDLRSGNVTRVERVRSYSIAPKGASIVAYIKEPDSAAAAARPPADTSKDKKDEGSLLSCGPPRPAPESRCPMWRPTRSARTASPWHTWCPRRTGQATELVRTLPQTPAGQFASGAATTLATGAGRYRALAFDKAGKQVAFMTDKDEWASAKAKSRYALYHARLGASAPARAARRVIPGRRQPAHCRQRDRRLHPRWQWPALWRSTRAGGVAPGRLAGRASGLRAWHYEDDFLQPTQKQNAEQMRQPWYEPCCTAR